MPVSSDDRIEELRADGVELVAGSVTDLAGVTRAKYVPLRRLGDFQRSGMGVSPSWSVFCVDSGIAFTPTIGVVGDLRIRIDPADVRVVDDGVAWAPGNLDRPARRARRRCACARSWRPPNGPPRTAGLTARSARNSSARCSPSTAARPPTEPWSPYGIRTSLDRSAFLVDLAASAERAGLQHRTDPHRVRPRPARGLAGAGHPRRHGRRRDPRADRDRPGRRQARAADLVLAGAVRGRRGQRRTPAPVAGRRARARCSPAATAPTASALQADPPSPGSSIPCRICLACMPVRCCRRCASSRATGQARRRAGVWRTAKRRCGSSRPPREVRTAPTPNSNSSTRAPTRTSPPRRSSAARCAASTAGSSCPAEIPEDPAELGRDATAAAHRASAPRSTPSRAPRPRPSCSPPRSSKRLVAVRRYEMTTFGGLSPAETTQALRLAWSC